MFKCYGALIYPIDVDLQVSLLRIHQDCIELAGLNAAATMSSQAQLSEGDGLLIFQASPFATQPANHVSSPPAPDVAHLKPDNKPLAFAGAVVSPAVQSLVRKLLTMRRQQRASECEISAKSAVFELTADELSSWLAEAISQISIGSRAAVLSFQSSSAKQSSSIQNLCKDLRDGFSELGQYLDDYTRRQAIKVDTQVTCFVHSKGKSKWPQ